MIVIKLNLKKEILLVKVPENCSEELAVKTILRQNQSFIFISYFSQVSEQMAAEYINKSPNSVHEDFACIESLILLLEKNGWCFDISNPENVSPEKILKPEKVLLFEKYV